VIRLSTILLVLLVACASGPTTGDPIAGKAVADDLEISCGLCHTLEAAEFTGTAAPNLDNLQPGYQTIVDAIREGPGLMPSYRRSLTSREIHDLAAFISGAVAR
jgi:cytochrome c6